MSLSTRRRKDIGRCSGVEASVVEDGVVGAVRQMRVKMRVKWGSLISGTCVMV